jgi:transcriptional regulator with XRE-family HTH domain
MAEKLGVSIPSIMRWEGEIAEPNDYNRYKIEQFLAQDTPAPSPSRPNTQIHQLSLFPEGVKEIGQAR